MDKHIAFFVPSFNVGGVERAFINLANSFVLNGHKVDFIVCHDTGKLKNELNENINIITFKNARLRKSVVKLYRYIKNSSVDCLITGPTYANIVALLANFMALNKSKIVVSQHSYQDIEIESMGIIGKMAPSFIKLFYNFAHKVIAVSNGVRNDMIKNYNVRDNKIVTIYNAVIDKQFYIKEKEKSEFIFPNRPYLVAVGRLSIVKNYLFMLKAYALLKQNNPDFNYDLVILGEGPERLNLLSKIKEFGLTDTVHLAGAFNNPLPIIKRAKLFIHTSLSEAMPLVYVEALALKVPVVTVINKGAMEILNNVKTKKIVDQHDEHLFITAVNEMLCQSFSETDFPELHEFSSGKIMNSFLEII